MEDFESEVLENIRKGLTPQNIMNKHNIKTSEFLKIGMKEKNMLARLYGVSTNNLSNIIQKTKNREDTIRLILYQGTTVYPVKNKNIKGPKMIKMLFDHYSQPENFKPEFREVSVRSKFKTYASYSREYKLKMADKVPYDMFTIKMMYGGKAHAINIFRTGKISFAGGYPDDAMDILDTPSRVLGIALRRGGKYAKSSFTLTNVTAQYEMGVKGPLSLMKNAIAPNVKQGEGAQFFTITARFGKDEIGGDPGVLLPIRVYGNGTVQVSKITTQDQVEEIPNIVEETIIEPLRRKGRVRNFQRFQKIVKTKPQKRTNNNVAPEQVTRSTTCPADRRPVPYKFSGQPPRANMYVGVNPQGQPCCYKVPKRLSYIRPKVIERFEKLGIQIPPVTKRLLRITKNNSNLPINVSNKNNSSIIFRTVKYRRKNKEIESLKIGSRLCERYSMMRLVDLAKRLGVDMSFTSSKKHARKMTKKKLCERISKWAASKGRLNSVKQSKNNKGKMKAFNNGGETRIGNRGRLATTYKVDELVNKAQRLGVKGVSRSMNIPDIIAQIRRQLKLN